MATWDTAALLVSTRRRARAPSSTVPGWTDSVLLDMANEELLSKLGPDIVRLRREWLTVVRDVTLAPGRAVYGLWTRAMMGSARDLGIVSGGTFRGLAYLPPEEFDGKDPAQASSPSHYTIRGTDIILYPTPNIGDTLRVTYLRRLNRLVLPSATMAVTGISGAGLNVYAGTKPATITTSTPCDVVRGTPFFDSLSDDLTPSAVVTNVSVTFTSAVADARGAAAAVGDYVCLAGETPVVQLPPEVFPVLAQRMANALMRPGRDKEALAAGEAELASLEASVFGLAERRVESDPQTVGQGPWP